MHVIPCTLAAVLAMSVSTYAQTALLVEAESGQLGSSMSSQIDTVDSTITYISTSVTYDGNSPTLAEQLVTYSVTLPAAGDYNLYARLYVGPDTYGDDSFFYGNGFGSMVLSDDSAWATINGLAGAMGYTSDDSFILDAGDATNLVWKWVRLTNDETTFQVDASSLTQTFQIAGREDGLLIDKFAFAPYGYYFTVNQIENGLVGSDALPTYYVPSGPQIASGKAKFLGSAHSNNDQDIDFDCYWNAVIPGNGGKWGWVEGTRDTMVWTDLDASYHAAKSNGYPFIMHVLVWGSQQPTWIASLSAVDQLDEIKEWYQAVAARYPDIDYLQVVNEPLHALPDDSKTDSGNYIDALGGTATDGTHPWIMEAFRLAKQYFPNTPLMINDYSIVGDPVKTAEYIGIINELKAESLIDVIGVQCHAFSTVWYPASAITQSLDDLAATGLPIMVTEMDVDGDEDASDEVSDAAQLAEMQRLFPLFWNHLDVMGVVMWGYHVGMWRSETDAFLVDDFNYERPAMQWLREYVQSAPWLDAFVTAYNWTDTGGWLGGNVYIGFSPWIYCSGQWVWALDDTFTGDGMWGFVYNPLPGTSTATDAWVGYDVVNGWAATGDWMGNAYVADAPWIWSDELGWMYIDDSYSSTSGAWAWMFVSE